MSYQYRDDHVKDKTVFILRRALDCYTTQSIQRLPRPGYPVLSSYADIGANALRQCFRDSQVHKCSIFKTFYHWFVKGSGRYTSPVASRILSYCVLCHVVSFFLFQIWIPYSMIPVIHGCRLCLRHYWSFKGGGGGAFQKRTWPLKISKLY